MRGQGRSDVGESALYSMQMYARDAATLMAKLGHKQFSEASVRKHRPC